MHLPCQQQGIERHAEIVDHTIVHDPCRTGLGIDLDLGTHLAEVEVDPETGATRIMDYRVVDDFGVTLNPLLLAGQVHGGTVQGIGQALMENAVYDAVSGQLISASLMDYALP